MGPIIDPLEQTENKKKGEGEREDHAGKKSRGEPFDEHKERLPSLGIDGDLHGGKERI